MNFYLVMTVWSKEDQIRFRSELTVAENKDEAASKMIVDVPKGHKLEKYDVVSYTAEEVFEMFRKVWAKPIANVLEEVENGLNALRVTQPCTACDPDVGFVCEGCTAYSALSRVKGFLTSKD